MGNSIKIPLLGTLDKVGDDAEAIGNWDVTADPRRFIESAALSECAYYATHAARIRCGAGGQ